ncbi:hypothetical protein [Fimbriimonas ginsengisoli]|uniref:Uncharacterized protein n=1 Tax=Fimbriimonas ginsengisoli Gsoil 348 TaxID=661478 RepID=A0A068NRN3_FIMGI|nr:hypothetical protein [Fimbriimonas ginsengisoli]AIE86203.1 hypothetical protein OP10G_2835 [Fimbriimonas ginsengisoli Gsoil 348]
MNQDKAREFFSAHYEETLEPGLRQTLEQRLRNDANLQADYAAFVETMQELEALPREEIEIPIFLSDRIATRLDEERARKTIRVPVWSLWIRGLAFSGLAAVAITGAVISMQSRGPVANAGIVGSTTGDAQPTFSGAGSTVSMSFRPRSEKTVIVSSGVTGRELQRFTATGDSPAHPFENRLAGTALFQIQLQGEKDSTLLALPGSGASSAASGMGTIRDFAVAIADRYHMPVILSTRDDQKRLSWKLDGADPREAASAVLKDQEFVVDQRGNGVLSLMDR